LNIASRQRVIGMICLLFAGCGYAEVVVVDDSGATVRLAQPARRIVSLAPHITETLFAAGAGDPQRRLQIYRHAYRSRLTDALAAAMASLKAAQISRLLGAAVLGGIPDEAEACQAAARKKKAGKAQKEKPRGKPGSRQRRKTTEQRSEQ
jgi:hypothetical protein